MEPDEIIQNARRIVETGQRSLRSGGGYGNLSGVLSEALEFLRRFEGEKSSFYRSLSDVKMTATDSFVFQHMRNNMEAFIRFVENGLLDSLSLERRAKIEVVTDLLSQAQTLLGTGEVHPAAPAVIIGASLEEFLRTWIEEEGLSIGTKKSSIDAYASSLREAELITKQDIKDVTAWAGMRNHAAHGEWDEVSDRHRVSLMLEGVNLFMRRYGAG